MLGSPVAGEFFWPGKSCLKWMAWKLSWMTKGHPAKKRQKATFLHLELLQFPQMEKEMTWLREEGTQTKVKIPSWEAGSITQEPGCNESCAGCGQAAKPHLSEPSKTSPGNTHVALQGQHFRKSHSCTQATQPLRNAALTCWIQTEWGNGPFRHSDASVL